MNNGASFVKLLDGTNRAAVDIHDLQNKPHEARIIIGTTRSLTRLVVRSALSLFHTKLLVIDEADATLAATDADDEETNVERVHRLLRLLPMKARIAMVTCNVTEEVRITAMMFMKNLAEITAPNASHAGCGEGNKPLPLTPRDERLKLSTKNTLSSHSLKRDGDDGEEHEEEKMVIGKSMEPQQQLVGFSAQKDHGGHEETANGWRRDSMRHRHAVPSHVTDLDVDFEVPE